MYSDRTVGNTILTLGILDVDIVKRLWQFEVAAPLLDWFPVPGTLLSRAQRPVMENRISSIESEQPRDIVIA